MSIETAKTSYISNPGTLGKVLDKMKEACHPTALHADFRRRITLGFKVTYALRVIPFLKKIGFSGTDGSPTEIYREIIETTMSRKRAMAESYSYGYASLFKITRKRTSLEMTS